eukprot:2983802-Rhodomonas_salina.3
MQCPLLTRQTPIFLRTRYAMSSTESVMVLLGGPGRDLSTGRVLGWGGSGIVLRACYAMTGTETTYRATIRRGSRRLQQEKATAANGQLCYQPTSAICDVRPNVLRRNAGRGGRTPLSCYARAMRCPVLTQAMLLPGEY